MATCMTSTLLLSDSGEGKTYQVGEIAVWWCRKTGGKLEPKTGKIVGGERTIYYASDFGGFSTIKPAIDLGVIQPVRLTHMPQPFQWLDKISKGLVPNAAGQWVPSATGGTKPHLAYDSMTATSNILMLDLASKSAAGQNIGGGSGYKFTDGDLVIASNNPTHYNLTQNAILRAIGNSHFATDGLVTWTARLRRTEEDGMAAVLGPQIAGKAMTSELPAWFCYTFRLAQEVMLGQTNKHVLYVEDHQDRQAPGSKVLANSRLPKGAKALPPKQDPANVPDMLELIMFDAYQQGMEALRQEFSKPIKQFVDLAQL